MITSGDENEFKNMVVPDSLLEDAVEWIKSSLSPDDVFPKDELVIWAENNGFIKEEDCEQ